MKFQKSKITRRTFLFSILAGVAALVTAKTAGAETDLPTGKKAISETDTMAKALGYKHDIKSADAKKYPQLLTPAGKAQKCQACNFYAKENGTWGKCQLLQSGLVNANGWCASWVKKA